MRDDGAPPPLSDTREERLRDALERAGARCTRQRAAVFAYLVSVTSHPTAEQVYKAVRRDVPRISLATVYKALEALVRARLAVKIADTEGPARYDGNSTEHYHLRCLDTGEVRDLPVAYDPTLPLKLDPDLIERLRQQGFRITGHRLELLGSFEDERPTP
jgi:Fur family transcriptional regulator, peroxide stress response regulator